MVPAEPKINNAQVRLNAPAVEGIARCVELALRAIRGSDQRSLYNKLVKRDANSQTSWPVISTQGHRFPKIGTVGFKW